MAKNKENRKKSPKVGKKDSKLPEIIKAGLSIDFEKGRTGHGISDLSYYDLFCPSLLQ
jgi:hypothetical protein